MELEKNIYGLSEGVFKACQFLGLKFPPIIFGDSLQHIPSDYFGYDFKLNLKMVSKLCSARKWTKQKLIKTYNNFLKTFISQQSLKKNKTDLNIYFCDYMLFADKNGASISDYFAFEFYRKSFETRSTFRVKILADQTQAICNDFFARELLLNKSKTNILFANFLHRDWLDTRICIFEEFKAFVKKHPRFFSKLPKGNSGKGAQIIIVNSNKYLKQLFAKLKKEKRVLEELVTQHEQIASFCPDTVNTIRVQTILDVHNIVHILSANGRFGRSGKVVDNFHGGGFATTIDPQTGIIISDAINGVHERIQKHPDTGKTFKGFQYPCWDKVCAVVKKMAKMIPQLRHVAWDIVINNKDEAVLIEANGNFPSLDLQQAPDDTGRLNLYTPFLEEIKNYKWEQMRILGYRANKLPGFDSFYNTDSRNNLRLKFSMSKLAPSCTSLMDLGCRNSKFVKSICPKSVQYFPVDFKKHFDEVIVCDFNKGDFPDIKADTILCAFTAEYVEPLPQFLAKMCNAAQKQILMLCRPISEKDLSSVYRWKYPFLTDFTEEFLIKTMEQNNFKVNAKYPMPKVPSIILYDFRRI